MRRYVPRFAGPVLIAAAIGTVIWVNAGSLTPPGGPVAPTMKTLVEVEPRVAIDGVSTPGDGDSLFRIAQSGSYYLTGNVAGVAGKSGIEIAISNVTVDLNGFELAGVSGSLGGIVTEVDGLENITVRNGVARDWSGYGVSLGPNGKNGVMANLHLIGNGGGAIGATWLSDCIARSNGAAGFFGGVSVARCQAIQNGGTGFSLAPNASVEDSTASSNTGLGFSAGAGCTFTRCTASNNTDVGFQAGAGSILRDCTAVSNGLHGLVADAGSLVTACVSLNNSGDGVRVSEGAHVLGVVARGNGGGINAGIHATGDLNRIEENHVTDSSGQGIAVDGTGNLIVRNNVRNSSGLNYSIAASNDYTTILLAPGSGFSTSEAWANFGDGCPPGLTLCSGNCVDLNNNLNHCGACGTVCTSGAPNTIPICSNGTCSAICSPNYADCNSNLGDGCEAYLPADPNHCGACNSVCGTVPNAMNHCVNGACMLQCNPGFGNCDNNPGNGCEVNLNSTVNNCGSCGNVCPFRPNAIPVCNAGLCSFVCNPGYANCNGNPNDGCEVNTQTDEDHCGACNNGCPQFFSCVNGQCQ